MTDRTPGCRECYDFPVSFIACAALLSAYEASTASCYEPTLVAIRASAIIMKGLMQEYPLVVNSILDYAAKFHGEQEVITCTVEGPVHRYTYANMHKRAQLCALALKRLGVG